MEVQTSIRLTQTVQKGGCAAKVAATELRKILGGVEFPPKRPELKVDGAEFDDAAIFEISPELSMVKTIDFFTPILDTPRLFGEVAAVNALSDVYAMGGRPALALAVLAFPLATLPHEVIQEVLQGACEALKRSGTSLGGGHSIDDDTLKFGLSVTGFVHPKRVWTNAGAQVGDVLILTKGLGTGTLTAGMKRGAWTEADIRPAIESMITLNNVIHLIDDRLAEKVHAATDITGFGLSGHSMQMAKASGVSFDIEFSQLPKLPGALEALKKEFLTKAHRTNSEYTKDAVLVSGDGPERLIVHDPQTSGGLLLSVPASISGEFFEKIKPAFPMAARIGTVKAKQNSYVSVH